MSMMESVREESHQEIDEEQNNDKQASDYDKQPSEQKQPSQGEGGGQDLEEQAKTSENQSSEVVVSSNEESTTQPTQPVQTTQPRRISPAPSLLVIIPHSSEFAQMEAFLQVQLEKCAFYKKTFEDQNNSTLSAQFETYSSLTQKDLELLQKCWRDGGRVPRFKFETIRVTCIPTNVDVKERELHLVVKTSNLPVAEDSMTYIIGEFEFPLTGKEETVSESAERWVKNVKIEPKNIMCCSAEDARQLDMVFSTSSKPFYDLDSTLVEYDRPMKFHVEKGRSRTLKRKFKPIKLTFYEKTSFVRCDKRIGTVQVKIDSINDDSSLVIRSAIMNGRKTTNAVADLRVRVREPLVDKAMKTHEEKILVLT